MGKEIFVMLHPEPLTDRMLTAAASSTASELVRRYPETPDRPSVIQVQCKRVEVTDYGLVRLVLEESAQPLSVAVRPELVVVVLDRPEKSGMGFLSD